jgi:membrane fusion protein, multidrug efflux system
MTTMTATDDTQEKANAPADPGQENPKPGWHVKGLDRHTMRWAAAGIGALCLVAGILYYLHAAAYESTDDAFIDGSVINVSPRIDGHVAKVLVDDNRKVAAGDLLVEIDARDYQAKLDAARASLQATEATGRSRKIDIQLTTIDTTAALDEAQAAVTAARSQENEARAQLAFAKAGLDQAKAEAVAAEAQYQQDAQDLKRYQEMARSNTVSPQQLDHAKTTEQMAGARRDAARSKVATQQSMVRQAKALVDSRQAQLQQAKSRLASAQSAPVQVARSNPRAEASASDVAKERAEVEQASLDLSYTKIYAPTAGFVTRKTVEPGVYVQEGQPLLAIVPPEVWVIANFKETQLTHMKPGQPATITVDTYPDVTFHGHVDSIQRGTGSRFSLLPPENATGNFVKVVQRIPVKIVFDRPAELAKYLLVPGMSVIPEVNIKK